MENKKTKINNGVIKGLLMLVLVFVFTMSTMTEVQAAKISKSSLTLLKGKTYTLKITGTKKKVAWKTSNKKSVKIVSKTKQKVKIKAVKIGKSTITGKIGKKNYKCKITVVDPQLNKTKQEMKAGDKVQLKVTGGKGAVKWKSSNTGAVTVSNKGIVTAIRIGTSKVTAKQNGRTMTCTVKVTAKVPESDSGGGSSSSDSSESDSETEGEKGKRKRWVVTKEAENVHMPIYGTKTTELECSCGVKIQFTDETREAQLVKWYDHVDWESDSCASYRVNDVTPIIGFEIISYPEEGYWEYY